MVDVSNRVFTNVKTYVQSLYPEVHFQNAVTASAPTLPAVSVKQLDSREVALDLSLGVIGEDYAIDSNVEIQAYSAKSTSEAKKIITAACDAMRGMSYQRTYGPGEVPLPNEVNQFRWVARFQRIVGSIDEIPKYQIQSGGN